MSYKLQIWYVALPWETRAGARIIFPKRGVA